MKLFIDSADPKEIAKWAATGLVDGVTTNPSLAAKTGLDYKESLKEICASVSGPVSAEVLAVDTKDMIAGACRDREALNPSLPVSQAPELECAKVPDEGQVT